MADDVMALLDADNEMVLALEAQLKEVPNGVTSSLFTALLNLNSR